MDRKEFALFSAGLKTYYPREQLLPNEQALELWFQRLKDIPFRVAEVALNKWVTTHKWSPSIADIREMCASVQYGDIPDWGDGWNQVMTAMRKYGSYRTAEALESMDEITRQCVRSLGWRDLCMSENIAVDRANFRMIYEQMAQRKKIDSQTPKALMDIIETMRLGDSETLKLEKGGE